MDFAWKPQGSLPSQLSVPKIGCKKVLPPVAVFSFQAFRLGYCSADGACLQASRYTAASGGPGSVLVGLAIFAVCYAILMAAVLYVYCRYCRGRGGGTNQKCVLAMFAVAQQDLTTEIA